MDLWDSESQTKIMELYYKYHSITRAQREFRKEMKQRDAPNRSTIIRLREKFSFMGAADREAKRMVAKKKRKKLLDKKLKEELEEELEELNNIKNEEFNFPHVDCTLCDQPQYTPPPPRVKKLPKSWVKNKDRDKASSHKKKKDNKAANLKETTTDYNPEVSVDGSKPSSTTGHQSSAASTQSSAVSDHASESSSLLPATNDHPVVTSRSSAETGDYQSLVTSAQSSAVSNHSSVAGNLSTVTSICSAETGNHSSATSSSVLYVPVLNLQHPQNTVRMYENNTMELQAHPELVSAILNAFQREVRRDDPNSTTFARLLPKPSKGTPSNRSIVLRTRARRPRGTLKPILKKPRQQFATRPGAETIQHDHTYSHQFISRERIALERSDAVKRDDSPGLATDGIKREDSCGSGGMEGSGGVPMENIKTEVDGEDIRVQNSPSVVKDPLEVPESQVGIEQFQDWKNMCVKEEFEDVSVKEEAVIDEFNPLLNIEKHCVQIKKEI